MNRNIFNNEVNEFANSLKYHYGEISNLDCNLRERKNAYIVLNAILNDMNCYYLSLDDDCRNQLESVVRKDVLHKTGLKEDW